MRLQSSQRSTRSGNIKQNKTLRFELRVLSSDREKTLRERTLRTEPRERPAYARSDVPALLRRPAYANNLAQSRVERLRMCITAPPFTSGRLGSCLLRLTHARLLVRMRTAPFRSLARSGQRYREKPGRVGVGRAAAMVFYFTSSGESALGGVVSGLSLRVTVGTARSLHGSGAPRPSSLWCSPWRPQRVVFLPHI